METVGSFRDRADAGRRLASVLRDLDLDEPIVLGLPRGGLPVAHEVARVLDAPLDVVVVRKVGAPSNPEFAVGALGEDDVEVLDRRALGSLGIDRDALVPTIDQERRELARRLERYRGERRGVAVDGRCVVVVDDGIATGSTAEAAARVLRARGARRIILAVPVGPPASIERLHDVYDEVVAVHAPEGFMAVGSWYADFGQTSDAEVEGILAEHGRRVVSGDPVGEPQQRSVAREVTIPIDDATLPGDLTVPPDAVGVVVFAHGSGSSRHSPRNQQVARGLNAVGLATVLFDLLTDDEAADRRNVFDIPLLSRRMGQVVDWAGADETVAGLPIGLFGASTGAAAALNAAAARPDAVGAVVSRGGRADMAERIADVRAPVLLVVGGDDPAVIEMNREAAARLPAVQELVLVPGAGHLFEGPGQLEEVTAHAARWFERHLDAASHVR